MRRFVYPALVLLFFAACSSSRPSEAMPAPASTAIGTDVHVADGLTEFERSLLRGKKPTGEGRLEVSPTTFTWRNRTKDSRSFSLRADVIGSVWLNCASRPGENLCLELGVRTLTDNEYFFRDHNWEAGGNTQITQLFDYLKATYPSVRFDRRVVSSIK